MSTLIKRLTRRKVLEFFREPLFCTLVLLAIPFLLLIFEVQIEIKDVISPALGAFCGAACAFLFNISYFATSTKLKNTTALRITRYLVQKIEKNSQVIEAKFERPARQNTLLEWEKTGCVDNFYPIPEIDLRKVLFLTDKGKEGEEALNHIFKVNAQHLNFIHFLGIRNEKYATYLDIIGNKEVKSKDELKQLLGMRLFEELEELTATVKHLNVELLISCEAAITIIDRCLNVP